MIKLKKIITSFIFIILLLFTNACKENNELDIDTILNDFADNVELVSEVDADFSLPSTVKANDLTAQLTWRSNSKSIQISNYEAIVTRDVLDIDVTLTCVISYNGNNKTKNFIVTVLKDTVYSFVVEDGYAYDNNLGVEVYEDEIYNSYLEVALYIVAFLKLPENYVLKSEHNRNDYTDENLLSCGGDVFQNREGLLPKDDHYFECDILYDGHGRNALRLVYSIETLSVYYTTDHYASFNYIYIDGSSLDSIYAN